MFSLYPKGEEKAMTELGLRMLHNMSNDKIFREWPKGGIVRGLISE